MTYEEIVADIRAIAARANTPGFNQYGVPLHACNGYRQDEHYWAWLGHKRVSKVEESRAAHG